MNCSRLASGNLLVATCVFSTELDFINSFPQLPYSSWTSTLCVVGSMAGLVQQLLTVITLLMCEKIYIYIYTFAAFNFLSYNVTLSAESVNESTPAVRVTWRTAVPPECVASVSIVFRLSGHGAVTSYTTHNTSGTQVIQNPLQCATEYYVRVFVVAVQKLGGVQQRSMPKRVVVGGKENGVHDISIGTTFKAQVSGPISMRVVE